MVLLGNLSVEQIEKRLGFEFPEDVKAFMESTKQDEATNIKAGRWHCFDLPFHIVCGDMATAEKIYYSVKDRASEVLEPLQFSIQN